MNINGLKQFFIKLEEYFPYTTMDEKFRGKHAIIYENDTVTFYIWYENKLYPFTDDGNIVEFGSDEWFIDVKKQILSLNEEKE